MIASLTGTVAHVTLDRAVVDVRGVGYLVHATPATLSSLRVGEEARLHTTLVVREDSMTLYGFADADEREVFETAQSVSGVGPRIALAMLAVLTPDALRRAIAAEDTAALRRVPGIGAKSAQRIVLELSGKLGVPADGAGAAAAPAAVTAGDRREQVVEALVGLGWTAKVAEDAVGKVLAEAGTDVVTEDQVATTLRAALRSLGGHRA
ncbi:Holliday junction branch migration protein RuvA [Isoptericola variabilis]|uniref:Holliday junction branch migration complex subunit RuvA n=1 Tax=Isoptericola variabilis (strain 225) TaxID=743718 RepID=F6FVH9_ISOV2|nr:Holliday junction branch migration protein RuvA [Isoptericola variabilis]AEG44406.1 Holliday junction ATP-dependent DNA helicase ruvA [Isoptericola variabilis 225]